MDQLTLLLSGIAALASVISLFLMIKNNRDRKRHLKHRLEALDNEYNGPMSHHIDPTGRDKVRVEINTIKRDLNIH